MRIVMVGVWLGWDLVLFMVGWQGMGKGDGGARQGGRGGMGMREF